MLSGGMKDLVSTDEVLVYRRSCGFVMPDTSGIFLRGHADGRSLLVYLRSRLVVREQTGMSAPSFECRLFASHKELQHLPECADYANIWFATTVRVGVEFVGATLVVTLRRRVEIDDWYRLASSLTESG